MNQTCHKCGYTADHLEFTYLCKNGCPACGESDLRRCPKCGAECVFSRAESLEEEESLMRELSIQLSAITRESEPEKLSEARRIISRLREMNMRWNIPQLSRFLIERQKELFL
ncbi:MAG: hypothetical protein ACP5G0_09345 [Desulfomonilia bacterium]